MKKNITLDIVQTEEGMKELFDLLICNCLKIKCLIDTITELLHTTAFSKQLIKLTISSVECIEFQFSGPPLLKLFARLEELHIIMFPIVWHIKHRKVEFEQS